MASVFTTNFYKEQVILTSGHSTSCTSIFLFTVIWQLFIGCAESKKKIIKLNYIGIINVLHLDHEKMLTCTGRSYAITSQREFNCKGKKAAEEFYRN